MSLSVFISYSSADMPIVEQVKKTLEASDIDVFVAEDSIKPGESLNETIIKNIKESDMFFLLWSKNATESDYVKQEIGIAKGANKQIIPFVIHKEIELPEFIRDIKYIRAYENTDKAFNDLCETVTDKAKRKVGRIILDTTAKAKVRISPKKEPIEFKLSGELAKKACKVIYPDFANIDKIGEVKFVENEIIVGGNTVKAGFITTTFAESHTTQVEINILNLEGELMEKQPLDYNSFRSVAEIIGKLILEKILNTKETTTLTKNTVE